MSRPSISAATPCPIPTYAPGMRRLSTFSSTTNDDTADLEYTRAITNEFANARPKRRAPLPRRPGRKDAPITIFEDVLEGEELQVQETKREIGGSMLLGKAARKMPRSSILPRETVEADGPERQDAKSRRVSTLADSIPGLRFKMSEPAKDTIAPDVERMTDVLKKNPRRRTIFVPSDDTTMLTIHPGANNTTHHLDDTFQLPSPPPRQRKEQPVSIQDGVTSKPAPRRPRMSLAVAPRRLPLQSLAPEKSGNVQADDVVGQNGGKENLPPGGLTAVEEGKKPVSRLLAPTAASQAKGPIRAREAVPLRTSKTAQSGGSLYRSQRPVPKTARPSSTATQPIRQPVRSGAGAVSTDSGRASIVERTSASTRPASTLGHLSQTVNRSQPRPTFASREPHLPKTRAKQASPQPVKHKSVMQGPPFQGKKKSLEQYPILSGDLAQPDLYEDDWLRHQEVALTEVINSIFADASHTSSQDSWPGDINMTLRERLVEIYHQPHVSMLHQRLQASLLYGALSKPRDSMTPLPSQDLGLRKRFMGFLLDSYPADLLVTAAEVVVGRQVSRRSLNDPIASAEATFEGNGDRRALVKFLETFLVELLDQPADLDDDARWRKIISRSLMLIWLLDQSKSRHAISNGHCLFKTSSARKSSMQVLQALAAMLIPSVGDISRSLRQMDYEVSHVQDPLDEVQWHVDNLATGMRDGVLLTRLVELLLFSKRNLEIRDTRGPDGETTILTLPDSQETLILFDAVDGTDVSGPLSRHLVLPAIGRASKLYNAQIALSALAAHGRLAGPTVVKATDIVDGHRERTLALLWNLVSTYGLDALVDFGELVKDITACDSRTANVPDDTKYLAQHEQHSLLQTWAGARSGSSIDNLTSAFADGQVWAGIVRSFSGILPEAATATLKTATTGVLRALGCSAPFIASLTSTSTLPSESTTLSNLAFLASRLLPLQRQHRAATVLQRAYRCRLNRQMVKKRIVLLKLAHACATVVQTQQRVQNAAIVLQTAWRGVLEARVKALDAAVEVFQVAARGWAVRRRFAVERRGQRDGFGRSGVGPLSSAW